MSRLVSRLCRSVAAVLVLTSCGDPSQPVVTAVPVDVDENAILLSTCSTLNQNGRKYYLTADLVCTGSPAFYISGNIIQLHLQGHSITGNYGGNGPTVLGSNVQIYGPGTIKQYQNGIQVSGTNLLVKGVTFLNDANGAIHFVSSGVNGTVKESDFQGGGYAGFSSAANGTRVINNTFNNHTVAILYNPASSGHFILGNTVTGSSQYGIQLDASYTRLTGNSITGSTTSNYYYNCSRTGVVFKSNTGGTPTCFPD